MPLTTQNGAVSTDSEPTDDGTRASSQARARVTAGQAAAPSAVASAAGQGSPNVAQAAAPTSAPQ